MVVDISELPYGIDPDYLPLRSATVTTTLDQLDREREARAIPWWIIVLAAVAGVLLLLFLIFALWKVKLPFSLPSLFSVGIKISIWTTDVNLLLSSVR